MSDLWNPTKEDRRLINSGNKKQMIHNLKEQGLLTEIKCPFCDTDVYQRLHRGMISYSGSKHLCTKAKKAIEVIK